MSTAPNGMNGLGYEQITSLSSAVGLAAIPSVPAYLNLIGGVELQAESQNVRYRDDGTDPTASVGMILIAGAAPTVFRGDVSKLKFIQVAGTAKLNVRYFGA